MKQLSNLIHKDKNIILNESSFLIPDESCARNRIPVPAQSARVNIIALGDVGGTLLLGLRLLGGDVIDSIGIYDLNDAVLRRYEREINQVTFPDGRKLPKVKIISENELFDCDMFVFCASKGVPPVGTGGDVRMAQLEANRGLASMYARKAIDYGYEGLFSVVSDPVDPLCKAVADAGFDSGRIRGYGLGVMNGRARYYADRDDRFAQYLHDGRAFGPHGEDLVIADSIKSYNHELSIELTQLTVNSNMVTRADGFKPYIAPAMSSGALSLIETLKGGWHYSSLYYGCGTSGAFLGCRNRRTAHGNEVDNLPLDDRLYERIENAYRNLEKL